MTPEQFAAARVWFRVEIATQARLQKTLKANRKALGPDVPGAFNVITAKVRGHLSFALQRGKRSPRHLHLARAFVEGVPYRHLERNARFPYGKGIDTVRLQTIVDVATKKAFFAGMSQPAIWTAIQEWLKAPLTGEDALRFLEDDCIALAKKANVPFVRGHRNAASLETLKRELRNLTRKKAKEGRSALLAVYPRGAQSKTLSDPKYRAGQVHGLQASGRSQKTRGRS
jgi:hypothetical protein